MNESQTKKLLGKLKLYRKAGMNRIETVDDITFIRDQEDFELVKDQEAPGGDVSVDLFDTEVEARAFEEGLEAGIPGDRASHCTEAVQMDERTAYLAVVHWGDSDFEQLRVTDHRKDVPSALEVEVRRIMAEDPWGQCAILPRDEWRMAVVRQETQRGYWDWVMAKIEGRKK
jgi:hypothetical protein